MAVEYEFEDPARCWVDLVVATRLLNEDKRKDAVYVLLSEAKNSHWTHELLDTELELQEDAVEYGGPWEQETDGQSDEEEGMTQVDRSQARTCVTARGRCPRCGKMDYECMCIS